VETAADADAGMLASFGSFFANLFATSQQAPLREGKAFGG
jgi:hypothetical protein